MIPYLLLLFFSLIIFIIRFKFLYVKGYDKRNVYDYLLISIIFISFLSLAYLRNTTVGTDYGMYYSWFDHLPTIITEIGIRYIYIISSIFNNPKLITGISTCIFLVFMFHGIKKMSIQTTTAIFFFISSYLIFFILNGMRQAISISILFLGFYIIKEKSFSFKWLLAFSFMIFLASLFHTSGIYGCIFILFWYLKNKKLSKKIIIYGFIFVLIGYFTSLIRDFIAPVFNLFEFYLKKYEGNLSYFFIQNKDKNILQFIPIIIQFIFLLLNNKYKKGANYFSDWCYMSYLLFYSATGIEAVDRFQLYFYPSIILFYDELVFNIMNSKFQFKRNRVIILGSIVIFWCMYYILRLLQNTHGIYPYQIDINIL